MGYYSEVSILCGRNVAKRLVGLPTLFGANIKIRENGMFRFYWKSVKWYEASDEEVKAVMDIVNYYLNKPSEDSQAYKKDFVSIIRLGDDDEDTYFDYNYAELNSQWVKRSIEVINDEEAEIHDGIEFLPQYCVKKMFEEGAV